MQDLLGDRMKTLEQMEASRRLMPLLPICIRIDGRGFGKYTAKLARPFESRMSFLMIEITKMLIEETGASIGYTQSDEISLVLRHTKYESQVYFDGKIQKIVSVLSGMASSLFNHLSAEILEECSVCGLASFDCRVWNVPNEMEAVNTLVWRQNDAFRNAVQSAARFHLPHKECLHRDNFDLIKMLGEKGVVFSDYPDFFKYGTFLRRTKKNVELTSEQMEKIPTEHRPNGPVQRSVVDEVKIENLGLVNNKIETIFDGADPIYFV